MNDNTNNQLAANVVEASDYWAKASEQTLELHALARRHGTTATAMLKAGPGALIRDVSAASRCSELVSNIRVLFAATAGALLRPGHASSGLQADHHRATGEHLAENEPKLASTVLPALASKREEAMKANKPHLYADFIVNAAMACSPVLNALSAARQMGKAASPAETAARLMEVASRVAPGIEPSAAVLAASTGGKAQAAALFERSGLPLYIALEAAARTLEADFAKRRQELEAKEAELVAAQAAERASRNHRTLSAIAAAGEKEGGFKDGLKDVLGIRKQVAEQA